MKLIVLLSLITPLFATLGVDMSADLCAGMTESDWKCLVGQGYTFAIVQAWSGGYGINPNLATCVSDAWNAGMNHVDVYMFLCPECSGNNPPSGPVDTLISTIKSQKIRYGQIWFDVEQCSGCWSGDMNSNCDFVASAVNAAVGKGASVGLYSSLGEWGQTVGSGCTQFTSHPLWYAHYDDEADFSDDADYEFGGWTSPAMKQFRDSGPCVTVDSDWYPD